MILQLLNQENKANGGFWGFLVEGAAGGWEDEKSPNSEQS